MHGYIIVFAEAVKSDFGFFAELVKIAGFLTSTAAAIALAWRGRSKWEPSDQDLPKAPQKIAGLVNAVALAIVWVFWADSSHARSLALFAIGLLVAGLVFFIIYFLHVAILTYERPANNGEGKPSRIVGGYWLTSEAKRKKLLKAKPLDAQEYLNQMVEPDKVWPRSSRAIAKVAFCLSYVGFIVCCSTALTCGSILVTFGKGTEPGDSKPTPSKEVPDRKKLIQDLTSVLHQATNAESRNGAIQILTFNLRRLKPTASSSSEPEVIFHLTTIYGLLEELYKAGSNHRGAIEANESEYDNLVKLFDKDPQWGPALDSSPTATQEGFTVAHALMHNRIQWAFLTISDVDGSPDQGTRKRIRGAIDLAASLSDKFPLPGIGACEARVVLSLVNWANRDLVRAENELDKALECSDPAVPAANETERRRFFFGNYYLLRAALEAEKRNVAGAVKTIKKAEPYLRHHPDPHGILGHVYLLIARASKTPEDVKVRLNDAEKELRAGDKCDDCRYNLACALAKRSESAQDLPKEKLTDEATELLLGLLERMKNYAVSPDIDAIRHDSFLKPILGQATVQKKLDAFEWDPKFIGLIQPEDTFWSRGIPNKAVRFSRLNDDRSE